MTSIIEFLKPRLNRRSVAFLLCLLLSGLFWLLSSLSKEYVDEVSIPVVYENLPENLIVINEPTSTVTAEVKGFGFDLLWHWLSFEKIQITVSANPASLRSFRNQGEKVHYLLTQNKTGKVSSLDDEQLEVLKISPDTLFLEFKPLFSKIIPVRLDAEISYLKQFGPEGDPIIEPSTIEVSGLKEMVDTMYYLKTEKQQWANMDESLTAEVPLVKPDNQRLIRYSQPTVQVAVNVVEFTEGSVLVPIQVEGQHATEVKVYPSEVEVKYQVPLSDYELITKEMFRAYVKLDQNSDQQLLVVELDEAPVQVRQTRIHPSRVEYIVQK